MRDVLSHSREKLRRIVSEPEPRSAHRTQDPQTVESVSEIMQAAARIGTVAFAFWIVKEINGAAKGAKGGFDEIADAWRNQSKAERDMKQTLREQDEKDTAKIRQEISADQVQRERTKLKFRPKNVRGHWEGNVFIPYAAPAMRLKAAKPARP